MFGAHADGRYPLLPIVQSALGECSLEDGKAKSCLITTLVLVARLTNRISQETCTPEMRFYERFEKLGD